MDVDNDGEASASAQPVQPTPVPVNYKSWKESTTGIPTRVVARFQDRAFQVHFKKEDLQGFDFSGRGLIVLYNKAAKLELYLSGDFTNEAARQVVFHASFGTFKEDLSLLEQITNVKPFLTRKQLDKMFRGMGDQNANRVQFSPVKILKWAKLSQASQTDYLSSKTKHTV